MTTNRPPPDLAGAVKKKPRKQPRTGPGWQITEIDIAKMQTRTLVSASTIRRWSRGYEVNPANTKRLNEAAQAMGLKRKGKP